MIEVLNNLLCMLIALLLVAMTVLGTLATARRFGVIG